MKIYVVTENYSILMLAFHTEQEADDFIDTQDQTYSGYQVHEIELVPAKGDK